MLLSVRDLSAILQVPEATVYRWIKQEVIPVYRINEQLRFNRAELDPLVKRVSDLLGFSRSLFGETDLRWHDLSLQMSSPHDAEYLNANVRRADYANDRDYIFALKESQEKCYFSVPQVRES